MKKNIALTWWWTWGHIFPLLAIAKYFKDWNKFNFLWFWNEEWLEEEIATKNNIHFYHIPSWKIRRYFDIKNFFEPLKNITWFFFSIYYILTKKIYIIFSKWWYVSLPFCLAWYLLGKKIYIHESDTVIWVSNKIISKLATKIFYTFPNEEINNKKHILIWQIINPEIYRYINKDDIIENEKLEILVIAGSQWSTIIFENVKTIVNNLIDINFTIILWDKNLHFRKDFDKCNNVKIIDFATQRELWEIYKKTDIAITRAWATTLWELYFFWVHSIIVPLKNSASNHQNTNASFFKERFWSDILDENNNLNLEIFRLLNKYKTLRKNWLNLKDIDSSLKILEKYIK